MNSRTTPSIVKPVAYLLLRKDNYLKAGKRQSIF